MALIHQWAHESRSANSMGTAVSMAARVGLLADLEEAAEMWYLANADRVLAKKKVLLWSVEVRVRDCIGLFRLIFGDDFGVKLPQPGPIVA